MPLQKISPLLQVTDLDVSLLFYTQELGFKEFYREEGGFVILGRDECEIFLAQKQTTVDLRNITARHKPDGFANYDVFIFCEKGTVDVLWKTFQEAQVPMHTSYDEGPINRSYGIRDFNIFDPDAYDIVFGEPFEETI